MNDSAKREQAETFFTLLQAAVSGFKSNLQEIANRWSISRLGRRRVPVLLQLSAMECGAACLAMILNHYGRKTRVAECRDICSIGRDGVGAHVLAQAARSYGFRVQAFSLEPSDLRYVRLPAIVHWEFNHFVVVERFTPRNVEIIDPACGRRRLTNEEFEAGFTGVVLTMEPSIHFKPLHESSRLMYRSYVVSMLSVPGTVGLMLQILGASLCLLLLGLALPLLTKMMVDRVLPLHLANVMPILAIGLALIVLSQAVATYLRAALLMYLRRRLDRRMMLGFFEHLLSLPFRFFQQRSSGDLLMRLGSNGVIRDALTGQSLSAILDVALVFGYMTVLLARAPFLGGITLSIGVLEAILLVGTSRRLFDLTQRDLAAQSASQSYLVEALNGVATLKASGAEDEALGHWSSLFVNEMNTSLRRNHFSTVLDTSVTMLHTLAPLLLLWMGSLQVLHGTMSLGTMLALNALAAAFFGPLTSLVSNAQSLQLAFAHLERIADVVNAEPEQDRRTAIRAPRLTGRIELRNVSFCYDANGPLVLRNITLTIEPGQKTAIAGRTGCGKSTLARLLLGLYLPTEGEILYDGVPLQRADYRSLRAQLGVVLQEPFLLSGSIRQNITFGNPGLDMEQVVEAASSAAIHEDILRMPMAYETRIAEGGSGLSGGQRQRLSLARALARRPTVLLLDEATSHLDVVTESQVEQNLSRLACTRIVIAHRLKTISNADQILVLEAGAIVELGTHEELVARDGTYASLFLLATEVRGPCSSSCRGSDSAHDHAPTATDKVARKSAM